MRKAIRLNQQTAKSVSELVKALHLSALNYGQHTGKKLLYIFRFMIRKRHMNVIKFASVYKGIHDKKQNNRLPIYVNAALAETTGGIFM